MKRRTITVTVDERITDEEFDALLSRVGDLVTYAKAAGFGNTTLEHDEVHEVSFTWDELSDLDKGAILLFLIACETDGTSYAREHYPVKFLEHPELTELSTNEANDFALRFEDELEFGVPGDDDQGTEYQRLYNLAHKHGRS